MIQIATIRQDQAGLRNSSAAFCLNIVSHLAVVSCFIQIYYYISAHVLTVFHLDATIRKHCNREND